MNCKVLILLLECGLKFSIVESMVKMRSQFLLQEVLESKLTKKLSFVARKYITKRNIALEGKPEVTYDAYKVLSGNQNNQILDG
jgi:translation initiation factor 2 alpha subunit (eIF-2alpha)